MAHKYLIFAISLAGLSLCACQKQLSDFETHLPAEGKFLISAPEEYHIAMTKGMNWNNGSSGNMCAEWRESTWGDKDMPITKGNVTGDEYEWKDSATVSLYLTDADNNIIHSGTTGLGDIPFNPVGYKAYSKYRPYKEAGGSTEITDEQSVTTASFFWTEKKTGRPETMPEKVNFYGYYPRPFDGDANSLLYEKTSIIQKEKAHAPYSADWNILPYSFYDLQTDENLSYHDVMCSVPEEGGEECSYRYGNQGKTRSSSVQLHFRHVFSLLKITIDKGESYDKDNQKKCIISDLAISGSEVYTQGTLNILTGKTEVVPASRGTIRKDLQKGTSIKSSALQTTMLVQPIAEASSDLGAKERAERFLISCKIDGIPFSCSIPDIALEAGKKYDIRLTLNPDGGFVFRIWNGAHVTVGENERSYSTAGEYNEVSLNSDKFYASAYSGSRIIGILCNGAPVNDNSGIVELTKGSDTPVYYDIIAAPDSWYSEPELMRVHFDAIWNNKYSTNSAEDAGWNTRNVWSDLSGHGNDGALKSFNGTDESGWSGNGLSFDGDDDIVTYPGNVNAKEYTMEIYIYVPAGVQKPFARMTAEGGNPNGYPCYYFPGGTQRSIELYAHGVQGGVWGGSSNYVDGSSIVQFDFVFSYDARMVTVYCNGRKSLEYSLGRCTEALSVPIASLGNRIQDNTRALRATFYSFILYDKALTENHIAANYELNKSRYGTARTE